MPLLQCYLSFCEADADRQDVVLLLSELRSQVGDEVRFHVYFEEKFGLRFDDFTDRLESVDATIILFTPEYRNRIDYIRRRDSGVYKEYQKIVSRQDEAGGEDSKGFLIIPVLWKGKSFEDAFPSAFHNRYFGPDLREFHAHGSSGKLHARSRQNISPVIGKICSDLLEHKAQLEAERSSEGREIRGKMSEQAEIKIAESENGIDDVIDRSVVQTLDPVEFNAESQLKYERHLTEVREFRDTYFVKTSFYQSIMQNQHYLYSGRKGAGKTTLARMLILDQDQEYLPAIDVQVNDWNLHALFDYWIIDQISSDLDFIKTDPSRLFTFAWCSFIGFSLIRSLIEAEEVDPSCLDPILPNAPIREMFEKNYIRYRTIFDLSITSIKMFTDDLIGRAPSHLVRAGQMENFRSALVREFTLHNYCEFLFGSEFSGLKGALGKVDGRRVLLCLDRFDTEIQKYRKDALTRYRQGDPRAEGYLRREVDWLHGLVTVASQAKSRDRLTPDNGIYDLFSRIKFFIILPRDRLIEVRSGMRDAIADDQGADVRWKPLELLTMLRKRLQRVARFPDRSLDRSVYRDPKSRYDYIIKRFYSDLPETTYMRTDSSEHEIDLFLGVLRHTFWRPRDLLIFYVPIIQRLESHRLKKTKNFDEHVIKQIISQKTRDLVVKEFLQEFTDTILNIVEIISRFKGRPQAYTFQGLFSRIDTIEFDVINSARIVDNMKKMQILYEIGFIGIKVSRQHGNIPPSSDFIFSYMYDIDMIDFSASNMIEGCLFAIHPVFVEYLSLIPGGNPDGGGPPVSYFTWSFIERHDFGSTS